MPLSVRNALNFILLVRIGGGRRRKGFGGNGGYFFIIRYRKFSRLMNYTIRKFHIILFGSKIYVATLDN